MYGKEMYFLLHRTNKKNIKTRLKKHVDNFIQPCDKNSVLPIPTNVSIKISSLYYNLK